MKVVALHTDFRLYWPARLKKLYADLLQQGNELIVIEIAGRGSPYFFAEKEENRTLFWRCLFPEERMEDINPKTAKEKILKELDQIMPDAVLSGAIAFPSGASAVDWAKRNNKAVVIFDDSKLEDVPRNFMVNKIKKTIYSNVDAVLCPAKDWLPTLRYWEFKKEAVFFGENVVNNQFWSKKTNYIQTLPEHYFLTVGRQIERKNFIGLLNAFYSLHAYNPESKYELVLIGNGPERETLENSVPDKMKNKVHFLDFKSQDELREIYQRATFFILPSIAEQWGLVINEAMAVGLPVIVSKQCGCASSLVKDHQNGFIFDTNNIAELNDVLQNADRLNADQLKKMSNISLDIIQQWDLDRFSSGAREAIQYGINNKKRSSFLSKILLSKWNGRYNQG
jgi:Glycosyltransferase